MRVVTPKQGNNQYKVIMADVEMMCGTKEEVIKYINNHLDKQEAEELINYIMED